MRHTIVRVLRPRAELGATPGNRQQPLRISFIRRMGLADWLSLCLRYSIMDLDASSAKEWLETGAAVSKR